MPEKEGELDIEGEISQDSCHLIFLCDCPVMREVTRALSGLNVSAMMYRTFQGLVTMCRHAMAIKVCLRLKCPL
jgi:hypothetical protein